MNLKAEFRGGTKFEVLARGHRLVCDQPVSNGGEDEGLTPPELMLASIATCAGYYAAEYLKTRNLNVPGLEVHVHAEKAKQPSRLGSFHISVIAPGLEDRHETGLLRAVKTCLIHNTLLVPPQLDVAVNPAAESSLAA